MPEAGGANIEIAHHLNERHALDAHTSRVHELVEIIEAIVLALVAITTAWSGYQAARWDGQQSLLYGRSSKLRVDAQGTELSSNQERIYDAVTVVEWMKAEAHGESNLAELFERRLLPEFRPAFEAWKKTDPLHNPKAPIGPMLMPEYHNTRAEQAVRLNQQATELFEQGTRARERADQYVRLTVVMATVLLLTAISQRFRSRRIRVGLVVLAFLLLLIPLCRILMLPRA
ncbi:MAG: hypothetical protein JO210_07585 [Acidobacteriaceae bacterium]|nr:hypothetical protein [Acidobacteriaceae bacterium]